MKLSPLAVLVVLSSTMSLCQQASSQQQPPQQQITIGRSPESAPLESAKSFASSTTSSASGNPASVLLDAVAEVPDVKALNDVNLDQDQVLKPDDWAFVAVFEGACQFSDTSGDSARSLIIYEGMQVAVANDGNYTLSFNAEVPQIPIVVRLQLRVSERVGNTRFDHGAITLAPIVLQPGPGLTNQQPSNTVRIRRTGYSHLLHRLLREAPAKDLAFSRTGVARFGSIPEAANYLTTSSKSDPKPGASN